MEIEVKVTATMEVEVDVTVTPVDGRFPGPPAPMLFQYEGTFLFDAVTRRATD